MESTPQRANSKMTLRVFLARVSALLFFLALAFVLFGDQDASNSSSGSRASAPLSKGVYRSDSVIVVRSDLVLIPVTVTDNKGRVVSGLGKEHFTLFEDKAQQEITHFAFEDTPVSIGIVFDASDSMGPKMTKARQAVESLLMNANRDDEFFFVRFSTEARTVVPLTSNFDEIRSYVQSMRVGGTTALLDAVRLAMREMQHAHHSRKAIIIVSDGEDNASHWTVRDLKAAVREQEILIYAIGIPDGALPALPELRLTGSALLSEITAQSGGRLYEVRKLQQLPEIAAKIGGYLRNQYILGYVPNHSQRDGTYRAIQLKVERPRGFPRMHVVWRQGYYAPKE
jgi:Ca-activated chloride channel homolog